MLTRALPLITRETVIGETPANRATSRIVTVGGRISCYQYHTGRASFSAFDLTQGF